MGGVLGWLLRLIGLGPARDRGAREGAAKPRPTTVTNGAPRTRAMSTPDQAQRARVEALSPQEFLQARRRVVAYVSQARTPIRQAAAVRSAWLADLGKVYAEIASSPTGMVLDKAGQ